MTANKNPNEVPINIETKNLDSRWVTLDINNKQISEAPTPDEAIRKAEKVTGDFSLVFVPEKGATYIL